MNTMISTTGNAQQPELSGSDAVFGAAPGGEVDVA